MAGTEFYVVKPPASAEIDEAERQRIAEKGHDCWAPENVVHSLFERTGGGMQDAYNCRLCGDLLQVG